MQSALYETASTFRLLTQSCILLLISWTRTDSVQDNDLDSQSIQDVPHFLCEVLGIDSPYFPQLIDHDMCVCLDPECVTNACYGSTVAMKRLSHFQ